MKHRFTIKYKDQSTTLNSRLALEQNLTGDDILAILASHKLRMMIFDVMKKIEPTSKENVSRLRHFAKRIQQLEFEAQKQWKFEPDASKHSWWWDIPHCSCPVHANWKTWNGRILGIKSDLCKEIVDANCIIHG
ncbi:hypothetical protein LCGC14_0838780 [marine sediment metagenome]|uniref:Uncharacterized protein n=1 Tax=marine sediment metagenome TaxID=412755 RepID=A0A0F9PIF2_9ZZZZ